MKRLIKIISLILLFLSAFSVFTVKTNAAIGDNYVDRPAGEALDNARLNDELNAQGYGSSLMNNSVWTNVICHTGTAYGICTKQEVGSVNYNRLMRNTVSGYAVSTIAYLYSNPPADLAYWIYDTGKTLGFIRTPVYAQERGIGFTGLESLLKVWKVFRNIAYLLLAIVMVIIGFMIMFRKKIDPKTVVTVQNALPRIIITLILITFSYAIVGIMIDLMYVAILFVTILMEQTGLVSLNHNVYMDIKEFLFGLELDSLGKVMTTGGIGSVWQILFPYGIGTLTKLSAQLMGWKADWTAGAGGVAIFLRPIFPPISAIIGAASIAPLLIAFILALALIFALVRLIIMFITAYIQIIFALIIGPIQILTEAIPGAHGFSSWFKNLLSNILVFPISTVFFLISMAFMQIADDGGALWTPPYASLPGGSVSSIGALFSLGVLFAIPTVVGGMKEAIKAKAPVDAGPGVIFGPMGSGAMQSLGLLYQLKILKGEGKIKPGSDAFERQREHAEKGLKG